MTYFMDREDFIDTIREYGIEKQNVATAYEQGTGIATAEKDADLLRNRILAEYDALADKIKQLTAGLEFYANKENWEEGTIDIGVGFMVIPGACEADNDRGRIARKILNGDEK